jgi:hypothetical protein
MFGSDRLACIPALQAEHAAGIQRADQINLLPMK